MPVTPRQPALGRYLLVFAALALGLMSKPMLVTLPFVLLLLDYWPLRRFGGPWGSGLFFGPQAGLWPAASGAKTWAGSPQGALRRGRAQESQSPGGCRCGGAESPARFPPLLPLLVEKLPLLALSVAVSIVTYRSQTHAMSLLGNEATLPARLSNALVGYASYLGMTFWPYPLAALYPFVKHPPWQAAAAAAPAWRRSPRPSSGRSAAGSYLAVGWFWYLGTLVPVIGLVQVGFQSIADRYTYLPLIGIFIMAAWGAADLTAAWSARARRTALDPRGRRRPGCGRGPNPPTTPLLVRQRTALHP